MRCQGLVRRQKASTSYHGVPGRAAAAATEQSKANILHLVEMPDPLQADDQGKDTGQQPAPQAVLGVAEARLRRGQPVQRLGHQQKGAGVLGPCGQKGGAGMGTGCPWGTRGNGGGRSPTGKAGR